MTQQRPLINSLITALNNSEAPLTLLRQSVAKLDQYEKLALATFLTGTSNPKFQAAVIPEHETFGRDLANACDLARAFPSATKIFFAIELLELQINRDEFEEEEDDDGELWGPEEEPDLTRAIAEINSYEGEDYSSKKPLLGKYDGDVDIDALPGFHRY